MSDDTGDDKVGKYVAATDPKNPIPKAAGFRVKVSKDDEQVVLQLFDVNTEVIAELPMEVKFVEALEVHLEAGRHTALGIIPNNTIH